MDEALEERAAIIAEGCGVSQEEGLRRVMHWRMTVKFSNERGSVTETRVITGETTVDTESARWKHEQRQLPEEIDFG